MTIGYRLSLISIIKLSWLCTKILVRTCWYWSTKSTNYTNAWLDNETQQLKIFWKQNLQLKEQHSKFVFRNRINNYLKELSSQQLRSELAVCKSDEEKRYYRNVRLESKKRTSLSITNGFSSDFPKDSTEYKKTLIINSLNSFDLRRTAVVLLYYLSILNGFMSTVKLDLFFVDRPYLFIEPLH